MIKEMVKDMFQSQRTFDNRLVESKNLVNKNLFSKKVAAFLVELSEFANELRFFKYWSNKTASKKEVVLEEFADCVHFLLSLGNDMSEKFGIDLSQHNFCVCTQYIDTTENFINIINSICAFKQYYEDGNVLAVELYYKAWEQLIGLGYITGFTFKDIEMAYYEKLDINYKRLESGY